MMKYRHLLPALMLSLPLFTAGCGDDHAGHDHDHSGHHHGETSDAAGHEDQAGHHHGEGVNAGPNGGHVVRSSADLAFEVVVDAQRRARITLLDDDGQAVAPGQWSVSGVAGERSAPVKLSFAADGGALVSDKALPSGAHVPMVLVIQPGPDATPVTERFELHLH